MGMSRLLFRPHIETGFPEAMPDEEILLRPQIDVHRHIPPVAVSLADKTALYKDGLKIRKKDKKRIQEEIPCSTRDFITKALRR
jgi:hypothetical protein